MANPTQQKSPGDYTSPYATAYLPPTYTDYLHRNLSTSSTAYRTFTQSLQKKYGTVSYAPGTKKTDGKATGNPFPFTGGYYSPDAAAAFTQQLAALRQNYTSQLASLKGQRTNLQAAFEQQRVSLKGEEVSAMVAAEGQAVERGVLGGSADIKNRIGIASQTAAEIEAARLAKQQAIADTYQAALQVKTDYRIGLSNVEMARAAAIDAATNNAFINNAIGAKMNFGDVPKNGVLGDVALAIGAKQVGVATYVFNTSNPGVSFDCSGFTSWVYQTATGQSLPHNADAQMHDSRLSAVSAGELQKGDLVFFWYPNSRSIPGDGKHASHVGIYMGNGMVMDASQSGNTIVTRAIDRDAFISARRVPWAVLPRYSSNGK